MEMVARLCGRVVVMAAGRLPDRRHAGRRGAQPGGRRRLSRRGRMMVAGARRAVDAGAGRRLRARPADRARRRSRGRRGRAGRRARPERRRQVDPGQGDRRAGADPFRDGARSGTPTSPPCRRMRRSATASPSCRRPRTSSRRCRSTTICCSRPTSCRRTSAPARIAALYAMFPGPRRAAVAQGRAAVRRPAADAGRGARADRRAVGADPRRAVGRPVAEDRRARCFRELKAINRDRRHHRPGRAEREGGARHRRPRRHPGRGRCATKARPRRSPTIRSSPSSISARGASRERRRHEPAGADGRADRRLDDRARRHRRDADLFDPALRQFRAWRVHRLGRLFRAGRRRRAWRSYPAALLTPIGPFSFGWALPIARGRRDRADRRRSRSLVDALLFGRLRDRSAAPSSSW